MGPCEVIGRGYHGPIRGIQPAGYSELWANAIASAVVLDGFHWPMQVRRHKDPKQSMGPCEVISTDPS
jgi:hypothetical protein